VKSELGPILLKKSDNRLKQVELPTEWAVDIRASLLLGGLGDWFWDQLRHLSEVLRGCCEEELVACTIRPA